MAWTATEDPGEFLARAGAFLPARATSHTVPLTVVENLIARGSTTTSRDEPALFGWWTDRGGQVTGSFMHTPRHPLHLSAVLPPDAVQPLADLLAALERPLAGVDARDELAADFARAWAARRDVATRTGMRTRLYRLGTLRPPQPAPPGRPEVATTVDRALLVAWVEAFVRELGLAPGDPAASVDDRLGYRGWTLWRDEAGAPVALAGISRPVDGSRRIAPVFTPARHRRRGYGAAVTAAACRRALDEGARELLLFADRDNATSTALYGRLGFEPVDERTTLRFEPQAR